MRKEFLHIMRDRRSMITALINPLMMLFLYGYGISTDIRQVKLGIVDWSHTRQSRDLVHAFTASGYFVETFQSGRYEDLGHALDDRTIQIGLVIPATFGNDIIAGRPTTVQVILDASDPNTANSVSGYTSTIISKYSSGQIQATLSRRGVLVGNGGQTLDLRPRVWYNEDLLSIYFIVPGVVAIVLMTTTATLTAATITREREKGSIEQLVASPVKATELMLGKTAAYVVLAFLDVILVVAVARLVFGVPLRGSPILFAVCSLIFIASSLGLGLVASAGAKTQRGAMTTVMLLTAMPSVILSGFVFPISSMPSIVQVFTYLVPARYFIVISRGIFLKGDGFFDLWPQIWPMTLLATMLLLLSIRTFKKRI
ncbi:MAG: ABC transporter permease [Fimbriimonas sp.]|nr:ABC transporter permease [Fimbriimonas sp.]